MVKQIVIGMIRLYQRGLKPILDQIILSVFGFKSECFQSPSCSEYTIQAIRQFGVISGVLSGIQRIKNCHT